MSVPMGGVTAAPPLDGQGLEDFIYDLMLNGAGGGRA